MEMKAVPRSILLLTNLLSKSAILQDIRVLAGRGSAPFPRGSRVDSSVTCRFEATKVEERSEKFEALPRNESELDFPLVDPASSRVDAPSVSAVAVFAIAAVAAKTITGQRYGGHRQDSQDHPTTNPLFHESRPRSPSALRPSSPRLGRTPGRCDRKRQAPRRTEPQNEERDPRGSPSPFLTSFWLSCRSRRGRPRPKRRARSSSR